MAKIKKAPAKPPKAAASRVPETASATACNICGGTAFALGPGNRLSVTKLPPVCKKCGSLERHRVARAIFDKIRGPNFKEMTCLIFGNDNSVAGGWFKDVRKSINGEKTALDVQKIALPDSSADVVVCNHLLTSVERYEDALREILRVSSPKGFAFVTVSNPHFRETTEDWGRADPKRHNQYRIFGADIEKRFPKLLPGAGLLRVIDSDPATGAQDRAYIFSKSVDTLDAIADKAWKIRFLHF